MVDDIGVGISGFWDEKVSDAALLAVFGLVQRVVGGAMLGILGAVRRLRGGYGFGAAFWVGGRCSCGSGRGLRISRDNGLGRR